MQYARTVTARKIAVSAPLEKLGQSLLNLRQLRISARPSTGARFTGELAREQYERKFPTRTGQLIEAEYNFC